MPHRSETLTEPFLIINYKNYNEVAGAKALLLARTAERVAKQHGVDIALSPPTPMLGLVAEAVELPVIAQSVEDAVMGSSTGAIVPEIAQSVGAVGSLVNHSERKLAHDTVAALIKRLRSAKMLSVVCADLPATVRKMASFGPDYVAIEPPELIGSGVAVSRARPEAITTSAEIVSKVKPTVRLVCGAGIVTGADVARALQLGAVGVLVASGIVKASDWSSKLTEFASSLTTAMPRRV